MQLLPDLKSDKIANNICLMPNDNFSIWGNSFELKLCLHYALLVKIKYFLSDARQLVALMVTERLKLFDRKDSLGHG